MVSVILQSKNMINHILIGTSKNRTKIVKFNHNKYPKMENSIILATSYQSEVFM
jgi:hypothetical protein